MSKKQFEVNYIKHLLSVSEKFVDDDRLSPLHISLYYALFQTWNLAKFRNPISVSRHELMRASKIGSANTYTKCLKELDTWAYIKYMPSHNPHKGSQIYLYNFNKTTDNATDISIDKSTNKATGKSTGKAPVTALIPYTNSINNKNKRNHLNSVNENVHTRKNNTEKFVDHSQKGCKAKVQKQISRKNDPVPRFQKPQLKTLENYFAAQNWPLPEAQKFFNHYQSNGWLVGGKAPMQDWQASAGNWMLNAQKFSDGKTSKEKPDRTGRLRTTTDKNYSEPL